MFSRNLSVSRYTVYTSIFKASKTVIYLQELLRKIIKDAKKDQKLINGRFKKLVENIIMIFNSKILSFHNIVGRQKEIKFS